MSKKLLIVLMAVFFFAPLATSAMSYADVLNYGRRFLKHQQNKLEPALEQKKNETASFKSREQMKAKHQAWQAAFNKRDVSVLFDNPDNFILSEQEINYFAETDFDTGSTTIVENLKVDFSPGLIRVSGYSLLKNLKGDIYVEIKIMPDKDKIYPKVIKFKYGKMWMPAFLVDMIVKRENKGLIDFLYSDPEHQNLKVIINENNLELKYTR